MKREKITSWAYAKYFIELKARLLKSIIVLFAIMLLVYTQVDFLFYHFAWPMMQPLAKGSLIATHVVAPIIVPIKFSFYMALIMTVPFLLYQLWKFVSPALYTDEKKILWIILILGSLLFYLGLLFCYGFVLPYLFRFMQFMSPPHVAIMPDIEHFLNFTLSLMMAFGFAFELPILILLFVLMGWISVDRLISFRPYAIVGAFIIGMLLTPPDVISQIFMAIPLCFLYELGILLARFFQFKINSVAKKNV